MVQVSHLLTTSLTKTGQKVDQASKLESCLPKGQAGIQIFSSPVSEHFLQVPRVVTNDKLFPLQYCTWRYNLLFKFIYQAT